jgi:hypothetical protein
MSRSSELPITTKLACFLEIRSNDWVDGLAKKAEELVV